MAISKLVKAFNEMLKLDEDRAKKNETYLTAREISYEADEASTEAIKQLGVLIHKNKTNNRAYIEYKGKTYELWVEDDFDPEEPFVGLVDYQEIKIKK